MSHRTKDQLRKHYEIEKDLASKLKNSTFEQRKKLYSTLYDELFHLVPDHPQLLRIQSDKELKKNIRRKLKFISRFLEKEHSFLEIGPGDCNLAIHVSKKVKYGFAVDVTKKLVDESIFPSNFRFFISDGVNIPLSQNSIDIAYSNQLIEHLHPDDVISQTRNIYEVLKTNGKYVCITPNKISGPHDISKYFDKVAYW